MESDRELRNHVKSFENLGPWRRYRHLRKTHGWMRSVAFDAVLDEHNDDHKIAGLTAHWPI